MVSPMIELNSSEYMSSVVEEPVSSTISCPPPTGTSAKACAANPFEKLPAAPGLGCMMKEPCTWF